MATTQPSTSSDGTAARGVIGLHDSAGVTLRPLSRDSVSITGGFWASRQRVNRDVLLPTAAERLEEAGNFHNLRLAAGKTRGTYRGRVFYDSDVYKWLESLSWEQGREPSAQFAEWHHQTTNLLADTQEPDGYLNSYFQVSGDDRFTDLASGHELFCAGHLIQAAIADNRVAGDDHLLRVARRFADLLTNTFGPDRRHGVPGHPEIEMALVELYRLTGNRPYLDLAQYFVDARGYGLLGPGRYSSAYFQDHVPVREASHIEGHAVRSTFFTAGVTDVYIETQDPALLEAMKRQWADMVSGKTYITGGIGSRWYTESFGDPYELPPDRAYCETCASVGSIMWSWRMLLITGDARYAELVERTLYNAFAAGLSVDGTRFFYTNPLQLRSGTRPDHDRHPAHGRQPWYHTACCPPNVMRMLATLDQYLATHDHSGLQLHHYTPSSIDTSLDGAPVGLRVQTDYPWSGRVEIAITGATGNPWTLSLRIPAWCTNPTVAVNGSEPRREPRPGEYLRLHQPWRTGDEIILDFRATPRLTMAHQRVDATRGTVAIENGPLVYCLEHCDQAPGVGIDDLAIDNDPHHLKTVDCPKLLGGVMAIEARGFVRRTEPSAAGAMDHAGLPYTDATPAGASDPIATPLRAIPYYAWANREIGSMRVWVPIHPARS